MNNYKMSNEGIDVLIDIEGLVHTIYKDVAGYETIGVGHLLTKSEKSSGKITLSTNNEIDIRLGRISYANVKLILKDDLIRYQNAVNKYVTVQITQEHFDALVSFVFNIGVTAFRNSTLLKVLNKKQYSDVPFQMKRWNKAGGRVIKGLQNRRLVEIAMWNTYDSKEDSIQYS